MESGFYERPPGGTERSTVDIVRVGKRQGLRFICVSNEVVGVVTHWIGGKSVRCSEGACVCQDHPVEARWRGYLAGVGKGKTKIHLFEFTSGVEPDFHDFVRQHGTLRGTAVLLSRSGPRANGKLRVEFEDGLTRESDLPEAPDLVALLSRIYSTRLPEDNGKAEG